MTRMHMFTVLFAVSLLISCGSQHPVPQLSYPEEARDGLGDIVYIGLDRNVYTVDADGTNEVPITVETTNEERMTPNFSLPTWSPDGRKVAFMGFSVEATQEDDEQRELRSTLYVADAGEASITTAFSSLDTSPFYLYWAPDSERLSFASTYNDSDLGLSLQVIQADGEQHNNLVSGRPMYWAWAPDGSKIVAHSGSGSVGEISIVALRGSSGSVDRLAQQPSPFQAPAYSPDGSMIAAAIEGSEGENRLVTFPPAGAPAQTIAEIEGTAAFAWSPDGSRIAYIDGYSDPIGGLRGQLHVIRPEPVPSTVSLDLAATEIPAGDGVIAFFWSPDGSKLAFFRPVPSVSGPQRMIMTLFVFDLEDREVRGYGTFPASTSFAYQVLAQFDQYQRSSTIWSPDSSKLVLSGMEDENTPAIYVVDLEAGRPRKVAEGHLAFWRPGSPIGVSYSSNTISSLDTPRYVRMSRRSRTISSGPQR